MSEPFLFNPIDPAVRRDPYALYERGRREFPVFEHVGLPIRVISVFGYADTQEILRDWKSWSSELDRAFDVPPEIQALGAPPPPSMLALDPPRHDRLRSLVNKAFTPRIVGQLEPRLREVADDLVRSAVDRREVDLVEALTYPLPVVAIAEMIGVPSEDHERFKLWSDALVAGLGTGFFGEPNVESIKQQRALMAEMRAYFTPLAEQRRAEPRDDLLTGLVQAEHEGSMLDHAEMLQMLILLLVAGNETTTTLIGNAVVTLLEHPDQGARLRAQPELMPTAIDEVLRFSSPIQFDPRIAARDMELHGVKVRENDIVLCWIGSANRDESIFERPDHFDIGRDKNPHLAFGYGTHYCLGHNLARLEAQIALEALLAHTRSFERIDDAELPLHASPVFRSFTELPLRLEPVG
jgi:cytochrome P450